MPENAPRWSNIKGITTVISIGTTMILFILELRDSFHYKSEGGRCSIGARLARQELMFRYIFTSGQVICRRR